MQLELKLDAVLVELHGIQIVVYLVSHTLSSMQGFPEFGMAWQNFYSFCSFPLPPMKIWSDLGTFEF